MDLYRYFYPHHNPRLRHTALRLQELGELEQAAKELHRAVKRGEIRSEAEQSELGEVAGLLSRASELLQRLREEHSGDEPSVIFQIADERQHVVGWETWARLVRERLKEVLLLSPPEGKEAV